MNQMPQMRIRDIKTGETHTVDSCDNTVALKSKRDGVRFKIHPASIQILVKPGTRFQGHTLTGTRELELVKV